MRINLRKGEEGAWELGRELPLYTNQDASSALRTHARGSDPLSQHSDLRSAPQQIASTDSNGTCLEHIECGPAPCLFGGAKASASWLVVVRSPLVFSVGDWE